MARSRGFSLPKVKAPSHSSRAMHGFKAGAHERAVATAVHKAEARTKATGSPIGNPPPGPVNAFE